MAKLDGKIAYDNAKRAGESWEAFHEREKELFQKVSDRSKKVDPNGADLTGAIVQFQVADGYAVYVVSKSEPLTLQHVPYMDAYQADAATIRGVNKNTVRTQLMRARAFESMGDSNKDFYASLKVGQVVHYHNSFNCWIRCTVVRGESVHNKGVEQNVLRPTALVGDWKAWDLPKRNPDGSVTLGYHAESVIEGKTMTPHESTVWESGKMGDRYEDPTRLEPVSLEVPGMGKEEAERAALWQKVNRLRAICNDHQVRDPRAILEAVKRAVEAA